MNGRLEEVNMNMINLNDEMNQTTSDMKKSGEKTK
jgi:hypothetical protein